MTAGSGIREFAQRLWDRRLVVGGLLAIFVAVCAMRLEVLFSLPFPPGGDAGEQLYSTHVLLGTAFPSPPNTPWQIPPLYYFLFFIPFTYPLPFFTGAKLLIGVVPALLVFPSYWLLRKAGAAVPFAAFGGALLASSTAVSSVASYNAGYNLAGLFFAVFFFAELLAYVKSPNRKDLLLASLMFVAVGATHFLTFLFVVIGFGVFLVLTLILVPERRKTARALASVLGGCLVGTLALIPTYYALVPTVVNVGPSSASLPSNLAYTLLPMSWGFTYWPASPLAVVDVLVTVFCMTIVVGLRIRTPVASLLLAMLVAGLALVVAYPGSYGRGVVFLPFTFCPAIALFADALYARLPRLERAGLPRTDRPVGSDPRVPSERRVRGLPGRSGRGWARFAKPVIALTIAGAFLAVNASYSYSTMQSSSEYYLQLDAGTVQLLDWLAGHTNSSAKIYLGSPAFYSWVLGLSNRMAYAPIQLNNVVTEISYSTAYDAWLFAMGQYVTGNGYLAAAESLPAPQWSPAIYLQTPYGWTQLENSNSSGISFEVEHGSTTVNLTAVNATVTGADLSSPCPGCSGQNLTLSWPGSGVVIVQSLVVSGENVAAQWRAQSGTLLSVRAELSIPPTGFAGLAHVRVPSTVGAPVLSDSFSLYNAPFTLTVSGMGGTFTQGTARTGWTQINYTGGPGLSWSMAGLTPLAGKSPYSVNTSATLEQLGVSYIVANYNGALPGFGYSLLVRCMTPGGLVGLTARPVYQVDGEHVFSIS